MEYIQPQISPKIRQKTRFGEIGQKSFFERFYVFLCFCFLFPQKKIVSLQPETKKDEITVQQ